MDYISANRYLNMDEMKVNARYISGRLLSQLDYNAIAGVLGNMQVESTINPGIWQNLDEGNMSGAMGLYSGHLHLNTPIGQTAEVFHGGIQTVKLQG